MSMTPDDLAAIRTVMQEEVAHVEARLMDRIDQVETGLRHEFGQRIEAVEMSMRAAIAQSEINLRRELQASQRANVGLFNTLREELRESGALPSADQRGLSRPPCA